MRLRDKVKRKYQKYRDYARFNRDLLIGELFAFPLAAGASQLAAMATDNPGAITAVGAASDYVGYGIGYGGSSFYFNQDIYWDPETKQIKKQYWTDMAKYLSSGIIGAALYYVARSGVNYLLLRHGWEPYQASLASQASATAVWYGSMNLFGSKLGFVHKDKKTGGSEHD